jgi:hypothetical protein
MPRTLLLALVTSGLLASAAGAELPEPQRHGPACTPSGCAGRAGSPKAQATGFGLAVLAAAALTRRERAQPSAGRS